MTRRPAFTLIEVLVTLFIMAIGMLALLVLFPLGALSMAQALKDDRCASAAAMAEQVAIAQNIRHNPSVSGLFTTQLGQTLPATYTGQSFAVYVDPYYTVSGLGQLGTPATVPTATRIQRTSLSFITSLQLADRWFSLPNDMTFLQSGTPDLSAGLIDRGRRYTWAYLLRRPQAWSAEAVNLTVVVYRGRATAVPAAEQTYAVNPPAAAGANGLILTWKPAIQSPYLKRGIWILDTTPIPGTSPPVPQAKFYRVVNITDAGAGMAVLDVQPNLFNAVQQVVIMDSVAEVFVKGTSWQP